MAIPTPKEAREDKPRLIPKVWTSQEALDRAQAFVQKQMEKVLPDHKGREDKWLLWDQIYRLIDRDKPDDGGANIVDPEPQINVDTLKANFTEAFFSQDPNFAYKGQEGTDENQAEIMTAYRADHLRRIGLRDKFERSIHQILVQGTAICKDPYRKEVKESVIRRKEMDTNKDGSPK